MITKYDIKTTRIDVMKLSKEQKFFTFVLIFYWLGIFVATHIPVPGWTRKMGMSDKTMHFIAYTILALLTWLATSFDKKADWKKFRPWLLSGILLFYSAADELLQHLIKRSSDIKDFAADILGVICAMMTVTFLPAGHSAMVLFVIGPLVVPGIVRAGLIRAGSLFEAAVYLICFAIVTASWIKYLSSAFKLNIQSKNVLPVFLLPPAATVIIVKLYASATDKPMGTAAISSSLASILLTIFFWHLASRKKTAI